MGKALIISGGTEGQYQVKLALDTHRVKERIIYLDCLIADLAVRIAALPSGAEKDRLQLEQLSLEKQKDFLDNNTEEDPTVSAWCADYTEDLSGQVGTVEIPGQRDIVQIRPGYEGNAVFSAARDGQLQPSIAGVPSTVFWNWAMMAGWQKWKPTFRHGQITSVNGDTCNVTLEPAFSDIQALNINQAEILSNVPIEYMECDGDIFETGDNVLIEFEDQDWSTPKVIGFKIEPEKCCPADVPLAFDDENTPDVIAEGGSIAVYGKDGRLPYTFATAATGYYWDAALTLKSIKTSNTHATLYCAPSGAADYAPITITDTCDDVVNAVIRQVGEWLQATIVQAGPGAHSLYAVCTEGGSPRCADCGDGGWCTSEHYFDYDDGNYYWRYSPYTVSCCKSGCDKGSGVPWYLDYQNPSAPEAEWPDYFGIYYDSWPGIALGCQCNPIPPCIGIVCIVTVATAYVWKTS